MLEDGGRGEQRRGSPQCSGPASPLGLAGNPRLRGTERQVPATLPDHHHHRPRLGSPGVGSAVRRRPVPMRPGCGSGVGSAGGISRPWAHRAGFEATFYARPGRPARSSVVLLPRPPPATPNRPCRPQRRLPRLPRGEARRGEARRAPQPQRRARGPRAPQPAPRARRPRAARHAGTCSPHHADTPGLRGWRGASPHPLVSQREGVRGRPRQHRQPTIRSCPQTEAEL